MSDSTVRRFVFLWHEVPSHSERCSHFDLMFEQADGLRTWAVETLPREDDGGLRARALPLHRLDYLEYEGEISGGRGSVRRVAAGVFETITDRPERVVFELHTPPYRGRLIFQSLSGKHLNLPLSTAGRSTSEPSVPVPGARSASPINTQLFADADWELCLESPSSRDTGNSEAR